jgi:glutamate racemase
VSVKIGVFDSGFGGLTVLRELLALIPGARFVYLGDTARLPYGSKSRETIIRYAVSSARFLHKQGAEFLVVACNTATALALDELRAALPIPVLGVINPGTRAARESLSAPADQPAGVIVLATQATVDSHAYARSCEALGLRATEKACPLLVPLVEEGWVSGRAPNEKASVTDDVLRVYLREALEQAPDARAVLLGCTHYPLLRTAMERILGELGRTIPIVDSAQATARVAADQLTARVSDSGHSQSSCDFFATDSVDKFARLGTRFLGRPVEHVRLVDLGG